MTPEQLANEIEKFIPDDGSDHWKTWATATMKLRQGDREMICMALRASPPEAEGQDTKLLDAFDKVDGMVFYTTNEWRGRKESGWAYWQMFGPEGPELYPTVRAAMQACIDDPETERLSRSDQQGEK